MKDSVKGGGGGGGGKFMMGGGGGGPGATAGTEGGMLVGTTLFCSTGGCEGTPKI